MARLLRKKWGEKKQKSLHHYVHSGQLAPDLGKEANVRTTIHC